MMPCTRCEGGFINLIQTPDGLLDREGVDGVLEWMSQQTEPHDVEICGCCGDGDGWYGEPGEHYGSDDPSGPRGPYAANGGLCFCD